MIPDKVLEKYELVELYTINSCKVTIFIGFVDKVNLIFLIFI